MTKLLPHQAAPGLCFETIAHGSFDIAQDAPVGGTFVAFIRGAHCKWSRFMVKELDDRIGDFALRGIRICTLFCDGKEKLDALKEQLQIIRTPMGYDLDIEKTAKDWSLYLTRDSKEDGAPALHWEPAQAWIRQDGTLGLISTQSSPNLWADATNIIRAIDVTMKKFPERGSCAIG
jgi:hypothetical protein